MLASAPQGLLQFSLVNMEHENLKKEWSENYDLQFSQNIWFVLKLVSKEN